MGLFFEVIVVCAVAWWIWASAFRTRRERRFTQGVAGAHDAGSG